MQGKILKLRMQRLQLENCAREDHKMNNAEVHVRELCRGRFLNEQCRGTSDSWTCVLEAGKMNNAGEK